MTGPARTVPPSTFSGPRAGLVPARPIRVGALAAARRHLARAEHLELRLRRTDERPLALPPKPRRESTVPAQE